MSSSNPPVSQCTCEICRLGVDHPEQVLHHHVNLLMSRLDERQRRWLAALLAEYYGLDLRGVYLVNQITGLCDKTIRRGLKDLETDLKDECSQCTRKPGAGRPARKRCITG
jgi:hypothetical protein